MSIRTIVETGSTNADLLHLAAHGAREGEWLRAERQVAGRGRQGRVWESPVGNLYASTLVRLRAGDPPAASLALLAAVALHEALSLYMPGRAILKWPNDVMVDGAKLALDRERLELQRTMPPEVLIALAAQELASKLQRIEHLTITPDMLTPLLASLTARGELPRAR